MEYKTVTAYHQSELDRCVNKLIAEGWRPFGGVDVSVAFYRNSANQYFLAQAMVRQKPESGPVIKAFVNGAWETVEE